MQHGIDILEDVHPLGKGVIDAFHSVATTRREVQRLINEQPAVIKFVTESENTLRRDAKPKMMFQHKETDSLWCWDFCDLPNFFNEDGVIATGVLLAIIEMRHGVKLHIRVLLKKEINDKGMSLPRTYRIEDAAQFAATTMYVHGRRPEHFYNDRDPRFKALANSYPLLTEPGQTPIQTFSPPTDEPWPRGLLEGLFQRALNKFAARFDGKYNKRNRRTILNAVADPAELPTTQKYENDLRKYLEDMDDLPVTRWTRKEGKVQKSRAGAYRNFVNPRACPPIRSLFHLPLNNKLEDWVVLDAFGFDFAVGGEKHFIPTVETEVELPDLMERWMDALLAKRKVHLFAIELVIGWVGEIYLGDRWYQIVPRSEYPFTHFQDNRAFDIAVSRIKQKGAALTEETMQEMVDRFTSIPKRLNTSYSGRYVQQKAAVNQPDVLVQAASTPIESSNTSAAQQENTAGQATRTQENAASRSTGKQPSTKSSPKQATPQARTSRTVEDTVDWSDLFGE